MGSAGYAVYKTDNSAWTICVNPTGDFDNNNKPLEIMQPANYYSKYESHRAQIDSLTALGKNWDGYGAVSVLAEIGQSAKIFLSTLNSSWIERITDIYPNPHGTIAIEWENKTGEKLSLELGLNNFSYFIKHDDNPPILVNGKDAIPNLKDLESDLDQLFGKDIPRFFLESRENS